MVAMFLVKKISKKNKTNPNQPKNQTQTQTLTPKTKNHTQNRVNLPNRTRSLNLTAESHITARIALFVNVARFDDSVRNIFLSPPWWPVIVCAVEALRVVDDGRWVWGR